MATDTARTTEKSYWGKSGEGETKQVKFKMLLKYSQRSETPASPPDYVLHPYTPDPQGALNATLPLYTTLY